MTDIIPGKYRKVAYRVYATIGVVLGAIQTWVGASVDASQPSWLLPALAVFAFVGGAFGLVAGDNVNDDDVATGE